MKNLFKKYIFKKNRKNAFSILFSLVILIAALPLWVGALIERDPYINTFSADAEKGFYKGEEVEFKIQGGDKQDDLIDAKLDYGDGKSTNFNLRRSSVYTKTHVYNNTGSYYPKLILEDTADRKVTFELFFKIEDRDKIAIKDFAFNRISSNDLGDRVYLDYEIDCGKKDDYEAKIDWDDGITTVAEIFCGPAITSHLYEEEGSYDIELSLEDNSNDEVDRRELRVVVRDEEKDEDEDEEEDEKEVQPKSRFFIKTAWPVEDRLVYFREAASDPQGRNNLKSWYWDFGDGKTSSDLNPTHRYNNAGRYKVSLRVTDKDNNKDTYYQWIEVYATAKHDLVRVRGTYDIYQIVNGKYHWIPTPTIFNDYGFHEREVKIISLTELKRYDRAKLLRAKGTSDIYYITESHMKRRVPNMQVFYSYGNKLEDVVDVSKFELDWYSVNNLIKYDDDWKIYYLENGIKYWIKSSAVFTRRGFSWFKIAPVNWTEINSYPTGSALD